MKRVIAAVIVSAMCLLMLGCSTPNSSISVPQSSKSQVDYSSKSTSKDSSQSTKPVYGVDQPLPSYDELCNNFDKYDGAVFVIEGYIKGAEYNNGKKEDPLAHYKITYDGSDEHLVEVRMVPKKSMATSEMGNHTMKDPVRLQCNLVYASPYTIPMFYYISGGAIKE